MRSIGAKPKWVPLAIEPVSGNRKGEPRSGGSYRGERGSNNAQKTVSASQISNNVSSNKTNCKFSKQCKCKAWTMQIFDVVAACGRGGNIDIYPVLEYLTSVLTCSRTFRPGQATNGTSFGGSGPGAAGGGAQMNGQRESSRGRGGSGGYRGGSRGRGRGRSTPQSWVRTSTPQQNNRAGQQPDVIEGTLLDSSIEPYGQHRS